MHSQQLRTHALHEFFRYVNHYHGTDGGQSERAPLFLIHDGKASCCKSNVQRIQARAQAPNGPRQSAFEGSLLFENINICFCNIFRARILLRGKWKSTLAQHGRRSHVR